MDEGKPKSSKMHRLILVYMTWLLCAFHLTWIIMTSPQTVWLRTVELVLTDGIFLSVILGYLHYEVKGDGVLAEVIKARLHDDH